MAIFWKTANPGLKRSGEVKKVLRNSDLTMLMVGSRARGGSCPNDDFDSDLAYSVSEGVAYTDEAKLLAEAFGLEV